MYDRVVFYDTETTGLPPKNYIVTLAYIYYERGKAPIAGQIKCNPQHPINPKASEVNGITDDMVVDWPIFPEAWAKIEPYFRDSVWIGYNSNRFDQQAMRLEFYRYGCKEPHHYNLDVMKMAQVIVPKADTPNHKLITMCKRFGIEGEAFHTSDFDTWGTKELYFKFKELNKEKEGIYDNLFEPIEIEGAYTNCPPPCETDLFDY